MANSNVVEAVRFTDKEHLPDEISVFEGLGLNDRNELVGLDEAGNTKRISGVGALILKLAKETGVAEEVPQDPALQKIALLENRIQELEARLEEAERKNKEVGGFRIGEAVALLVEGGETKEQEYEWGYEVVGFEDETEDKKIVIEDVDTRQRLTVVPEWLAHEDELDLKEDDDSIDPKSTPIERSGYRKWTGKVGDWMLGRQVMVANGTYNLIDRRRGTRTIVEEDIATGYENTSQRAGVVGLGVFAVGAVAGGLLVELFEHKIFGHSSSREARQIAQNHAAEMKAISGVNGHINDAMTTIDNHTDAVGSGINKHISGVAQEFRGHVHNLTQELNHVKHTEALEHGGSLNYASSFSNRSYGNYQYPWDWAVSKVGTSRAETWLHSLAQKAATHGHKVHWIFNGYEPNGSVREILQVDGTTNTQKVVQIVSQYR